MQLYPATALGATLLLQIVAAAIFTTTAVLAPALPAELGLDESGIGLFGAFTFLGAMFGSPIAAAFIARHGAIRLTQTGMLISLFGLSVLYMQNHWLALAGALFIGLGYGPNAPGGSHLLARHSPPGRRGLFFSIKQSGVPVGGTIIGLMVPALEEGFGWRTAAAAVLLFGVTVVLVVQPWRNRLDVERNDPSPPVRLGLRDIVPFDGMKAHPLLPFMSFTAFTYGAGQMIMFTYTVTFLTRQAGLSLVEAGQAFAVMQATSFVMRIFAGWLNDRWRRPRPLLCAFGLVTAAGVTLLANVDTTTPHEMIFLIAALCGAAAAGWNGVYLAEVARIVPPDRVAAATGATVFCTYFGLVIGPALFGFAVTTEGYRFAYAGLAAASLIGAAAVFARKHVA